ncbi:hypothetical protein OEA41_005149 [Lepraria neglecta]|uniref:Uncharacterized protein n=1 Tax=Lepraria neglecta TaxID=209136 RepID=A0AAE0DGF0_9LECA|nr:hypothetical protein OEA41_005149 [Lepraria neglecta]
MRSKNNQRSQKLQPAADVILPYLKYVHRCRCARLSVVMPTNMENINAVRNSSQLPHPFYPLEANIVGYLANKWSVSTLLGIFIGGWVVILGTTLALVRRHNPTLPSKEKATILWFVLSE